MTTLTRDAPAKINLYLEITSRRPDGYHNIESVMQTVTLFDTLTVTRRDSDGRGIIIECDTPGVPLDGRNLVHRAASLFFDEMEIADRSVTFSLQKRIPMAAGLGGGSSDAAAALLALNGLYGAELSIDSLCSLGVRIGADVPFCIKRGISITRGIGDVFAPCPRIPDCYIVIACAGEGVSTPWAYKRLDEMYDFTSRDVSAERFADAAASGDITAVASAMTNIFESAVLPERESARKIRGVLGECGALKAMMSGSGPSVFGIFTEEKVALLAVRRLEKEGIAAHLAKPYYPAS